MPVRSFLDLRAKAFPEESGEAVKVLGLNRPLNFRECCLHMTYNETAEMAIPHRDKRSPRRQRLTFGLPPQSYQ